MNELKLIDPALAREQMSRGIMRTRTQLLVVQQVIDSLRSMAGNTFGKKMTNKLTQWHPSLKFVISSPYSWYSLEISGEGFDEINLQLVYKSEPAVVNIKRIEELNQRYLLDEERLVVYEEELKTVEARVTRWNAAVLELLAAKENLGEGHFYFSDNSTPRVKDKAGNIVS
jgi:hypothetical protein